jgi:hypothetical protein
LRLLAIVPESLPGHLGVELAESLLRLGDVKETSANGPVSRPRSSTEIGWHRTYPVSNTVESRGTQKEIVWLIS